MSDNNDDITIDNGDDLDDSVVAEEAVGETVKKLRGKLKEAEAKAKEYLDGWQRAQADFANLRKRDEAEKIESVKYAGEQIVKELIPVLDSMHLAIAQGHKDMEPVYSQLLKALKKHGLEEQDPAGESFDPNLHEAVGMVKTDKEEDDHRILEVMQKGYILNGKIIRPAKVKIGEYNG